MASAGDWGWVAGVIEGEGCFHFPQGRNSVRVTVQMTDRDVVDRLYAITGLGQVCGPFDRSPHKDQFYWGVSRRNDVLAILDKIEPYLGTRRRERAKEARERLANVKRNGYCHAGHPMSGDNLYVDPRRNRRCRTCARERSRERYLKARKP